MTSYSIPSRSYLLDLACSSCGEKYAADQVQTYCTNCTATLLAKYDLESIKRTLDRDALRQRPRGIWRWFELLPVKEKRFIVSMGEGDSPLLPLDKIKRDIGLNHLFLKDESINPTGSFKARGISVAISKAIELGVNKIVIPSAGNAGAALAAYAARAGIKSRVIIPNNSPTANIIETEIMGSELVKVNGLINEAGRFASDIAAIDGWFNMSTFKEPYRVEGKKIMGYEIAECLGWTLPDKIIYPTGGGTGLVGMWKAFHEMESLGWLKSTKKPKMIAVQSEGCAPLVKAFDTNQPKCELWENASTIATGLCVPISFADQLILKYIHESHGSAISVADEEIIESRIQIARIEGIFTCPEGAATLAGLKQLVKQGAIDQDETIVLFNTGNALKYINT